MYRAAIHLVEFNSVLHRFDRTKVAISHALKVSVPTSKLVAICRTLVRYHLFLFPIAFRALVQDLFCVVMINLFIAALRMIVVNDAIQAFVFVLVVPGLTPLFCIQTRQFVATRVYDACWSI